jgi:hypothetical protein
MPVTCHAIKYLALSPVVENGSLSWRGEFDSTVSGGTLEEVQSRYESVLRERLGYSADTIRCVSKPQVGYYTFDPAVQGSRRDYDWTFEDSNGNGLMKGPDFCERGSLKSMLESVRAFLEADNRVPQPKMSIMYSFLSGEMDQVPAASMPVSKVLVSTPAVGGSESDDDELVGTSMNLFGDDDF